MALLTLVRHGQATAFTANTDRLSALGETQARTLGRYWIRNEIAFDLVYTGTLVRQRRTEEVVAEEFASAGVAWPAAQTLAELNEYEADGVIRELGGPEFPRLMEAYRDGGDPLERNRRFQKIFEALMTRWAAGDVEAPGVESWISFRERVRRGMERLTGGSGSGRRVAAFTSGGFIGVAVQLALGAPDSSGLEVNWRVRNCSLTEFVFSGGRVSLDTFNAIPHLDDPGLRSFR